MVYGVRDPETEFKGKDRATHLGFPWFSIEQVVSQSEVVVLCVSAKAAIEVSKRLGDVSKKIIVDVMNLVSEKLPGFSNTSDAILSNCNVKDLVKCFNTTGFENISDPFYNGVPLDMFFAGDSQRAKAVACNWQRILVLTVYMILAESISFTSLNNGHYAGFNLQLFK